MKLAQRIWKGEYIHLADILSESLAAALADDPSTSKTKGKKRHSAKITNIATWTECFATYTSLVSMRNPARTQDLLAYMSLIAHASRQYKGDEWLSYDAVFRQQAADHPEWKWASVNTSLWPSAMQYHEITVPPASVWITHQTSARTQTQLRTTIRKNSNLSSQRTLTAQPRLLADLHKLQLPQLFLTHLHIQAHMPGMSRQPPPYQMHFIIQSLLALLDKQQTSASSP